MIPALDPVNDARHDLDPGPDARESLAFAVDLPEEDVGVIVYTWVTGESRAGCALAVYGPAVGERPIFEHVDGVGVPRDQGFDAWSVGPILVTQDEPLVSTGIAFAGDAASIEYRFEALNPAYNYGASHTGCAWYLAEDRFEQSGRVRGTLTIGDRTIPFDATGHRDHSWGRRNWGAIQHWKWILAQTDGGTAVHVMEVIGLGEHQVLGYVEKDGTFAEVTSVSALTYDLRPDLMHTALSLTAHDDAGRETTLQMEARADFVFPVSPNCTMHEVAMATRVDGVEGRGHVEMGWPKAYLDQAQADAGVHAALSASGHIG